VADEGPHAGNATIPATTSATIATALRYAI